MQEALTNCARHSQASKIWITVNGGTGAIVLIVEDNGVGFDVPEARSRGLGLLGVEERVREIRWRDRDYLATLEGRCVALRDPYLHGCRVTTTRILAESRSPRRPRGYPPPLARNIGR